jgi:hypothetical protein
VTSAGRDAVKSHERRVKRLGRRYGVSLMKCEKPIGKVLAHGGYMLREDDTRKIVFGASGYEFSATLEEVEEFLLAQPTGREKD